MKATSLRDRLDELIRAEGDLEVGFEDTEWDCFNEIEKVEPRDTNIAEVGPHRANSDDESLGARFIAIS